MIRVRRAILVCALAFVVPVGISILSGQTTSCPAQFNVFNEPCWTDGTRPSNPQVGTYGYNATQASVEWWNGAAWAQGGGGGGGAVTVADGADVAEGATTDAAVNGDNPGTVSAKLRGLNKLFFDVWDSVNHRLNVGVGNGADVTEGSTSDAAVTGDNSGTLSAKLRGLNKTLSQSSSIAPARPLYMSSAAEQGAVVKTGSGFVAWLHCDIESTAGTLYLLDATSIPSDATPLVPVTASGTLLYWHPISVTGSSGTFDASFVGSPLSYSSGLVWVFSTTGPPSQFVKNGSPTAACSISGQ